MESLLGIRGSKPRASHLAGTDAFRGQPAESSLRQIARSEWWLWVSTFFVVTLSAMAFLLSSFPAFIRHAEHFYEIRSDQARWATLCLLLLFNGWMIYRQWSFRRQRKQLNAQNSGAQSEQIYAGSATTYPATGLHPRFFIEPPLWKETPRARRQKSAMRLAHAPLVRF